MDEWTATRVEKYLRKGWVRSRDVRRLEEGDLYD